MAYVEKYYHQYCNPAGLTCRVSVLEENYVGAATELNAQRVPFRKNYDNSEEFKFEPIRPSTGEAFFVFGEPGNTIDFEEFWTADERKFQLQHIVNGEVDWIGFIIPNGFQYELRGGVYFGSLQGADGLSTLADIPFAFANDEPYGTQDLTYNDGFLFPWILIATEILRKLDLALDTWTCIDVYEQTMNKTANSRDGDPLATSRVNVKTYINDSTRKDIPYWADVNEVLNCKEVLENLCRKFGAKVYQSGGTWRIKRVNADATYGTGVTQRYWRKYNTLAVYIGRETINQDTTIPCNSLTEVMIGEDHIVRMDDVFGAYRMNYDFTFVRVGDEVQNDILNPGFDNYDDIFSSKLSAPPNWFRWREGNNWHLGIIKDILSSTEPGKPAEYNFGVTLGDSVRGASWGTDRIDFTAHPWNSLRYAEPLPYDKGDRLVLSTWARFEILNPANSDSHFAGVMRFIFEGDDGKTYLGVNASGGTGEYKLMWKEDVGGRTTDDFMYFLRRHDSEDGRLDNTEAQEFRWRQWKFNAEPLPAGGNLIIDLIGLGRSKGKSSKNFPKMFMFNALGAGEGTNRDRIPYYTPRQGEFKADGGALEKISFTGISVGSIPDEDEFAPSVDYIYENPNSRYSLEVDPVTVLNGDTLDPNHISAIDVPSNTSGAKNFWDTIDDQFGKSSLGLVTVKSIMQLYVKPFRLIEGTVKANNIDIDTRFTFEALPGLRFMLLSGSFNEKDAYVEDAVFFEISDEPLAAGGTEGNNNLDPNWRDTGEVRCKKDGSGLNTGTIEVQQEDINPSSETYGQFQWVDSLVDLGRCPLGVQQQYYWGTDDITLNVANLEGNLAFEDTVNGSLEVSVQITNPGGEYVYFIHAATLGVVEVIETTAQENIISDFQYLADITVGGSTFRVLRQDYVTATYNNFPITFIFAP